jgi:prepilin signal peptidase PulO-like enzyme (type II secretory pathway)
MMVVIKKIKLIKKAWKYEKRIPYVPFITQGSG